MIRTGVAAVNILKVDYDKTGSKVSALLFGQFIEHWGRCINYDGICAEMLVNNKFMDVPGSNYYCTGLAFPWELTKFSWGVKYSIDRLVYMHGGSSQLIDKENGNNYHYGICQKVYVEKGKKYKARVLLKTNTVGMTVRIALCNKDETEIYYFGNITLNTPQWEVHELILESGSYDLEAKFVIAIANQGRLWVDYASLTPADSICMSRIDLLDVIRGIKPSIVRWPGGWFADHYHWEDGIGPYESRPTRVRRELSPIEANNFGTDEYMQFCRYIGAEPYINLNFGSGSLKEIMNWAEYCNGTPETEYGSQRAKVHPEPYKVVYWCIGNEMYLKRFKTFYVEPEYYAAEVVKISRLLKGKYPYVKIIATGHSEVDSDWNRRVLEVCGRDIDMLTIHKFIGGNWYQEGMNLEDDYMVVGDGIDRNERDIANTIRLVESMGLYNVKIGMDEWNVWLPCNNYLEHDYTIREGIYTARMLHLFYKYSDMVTMSAPAQLVNVMGIINTDRDKIVTSPSYNVFKLHSCLSGCHTAKVKMQLAEDGGKFLDCMALVSPDGKKYLSVVNWSSIKSIKAKIEFGTEGGFICISASFEERARMIE